MYPYDNVLAVSAADPTAITFRIDKRTVSAPNTIARFHLSVSFLQRKKKAYIQECVGLQLFLNLHNVIIAITPVNMCTDKMLCDVTLCVHKTQSALFDSFWNFEE